MSTRYTLERLLINLERALEDARATYRSDNEDALLVYYIEEAIYATKERIRAEDSAQ